MALILEIKVSPGSRLVRWNYDLQGMLKCSVKSKPEKGAANKELCKLLSSSLGITLDSIEIIAGLSVRKKIIKIHTAITKEEVLTLLGFDLQNSIIK